MFLRNTELDSGSEELGSAHGRLAMTYPWLLCPCFFTGQARQVAMADSTWPGDREAKMKKRPKTSLRHWVETKVCWEVSETQKEFGFSGHSERGLHSSSLLCNHPLSASVYSSVKWGGMFLLQGRLWGYGRGCCEGRGVVLSCWRYWMEVSFLYFP